MNKWRLLIQDAPAFPLRPSRSSRPLREAKSVRCLPTCGLAETMQLKRPGSTAAPAVVQRAPALNPTRGAAPNGECFPAPSVGREARPTAPGAGAVPRSTAWFRLNSHPASSPDRAAAGGQSKLFRRVGARGVEGFHDVREKFDQRKLIRPYALHHAAREFIVAVDRGVDDEKRGQKEG